MAGIFIAPAKYVQGAGALRELGGHVASIGRHALVVGGKSGLAATWDILMQSFRSVRACSLTAVPEQFGGETTDAEIARIANLARTQACDMLIAAGGGKAIDAVKAAAEQCGIPAVIVPTIASNDSPCSALSIIYNTDGSFNRLQPLKRNPALVLVDTEIIASAPVRQLIAGMGDAIATWYEADACFQSGARNLSGGTVTQTALALARLSRDILLEHGAAAVRECRAHTPGTALERVVEANTLLSGLGFESAGVALAHALSEGFSAVPALHHATHGEAVAFCLLVQLMLERRDEAELRTIYAFHRSVGLPVTLAELGGAQATEAELRRAADIAAEPGRPSHNMPFEVTGPDIYNALLRADAYGQKQ